MSKQRGLRRRSLVALFVVLVGLVFGVLVWQSWPRECGDSSGIRLASEADGECIGVTDGGYPFNDPNKAANGRDRTIIERINDVQRRIQGENNAAATGFAPTPELVNILREGNVKVVSPQHRTPRRGKRMGLTNRPVTIPFWRPTVTGNFRMPISRTVMRSRTTMSWSARSKPSAWPRGDRQGCRIRLMLPANSGSSAWRTGWWRQPAH
jgi:hypothetical protein